MDNIIHLPYGRGTLELRIPDGCPFSVLEQKKLAPPESAGEARGTGEAGEARGTGEAGEAGEAGGAYATDSTGGAHATGGSDCAAQILRRALENPIGSPGLRELTKTAGMKILIITNDNTRPMPSAATIPAIVGQFCRPENEYDITVLIATGLHRPMTPDEMREQFGAEVCRKYKIVNHSAKDGAGLARFGRLSTGNELYLNKLVAQSDLVVAEGFIEPHFFAGYSGGRKSILPGVAGESTILANHGPANIACAGSRQGCLDGNPIHEECVEAARMAGLKFILNVALDDKKRIVAAFAGDPVEAHLAGCRYVEGMTAVGASPSDIVVTTNSGYPLDRNLYQVVKGIDAASRIAKDGGVIVAAARCEDGVGHRRFGELLLSCGSVAELNEKMSAPPSEADKWQAQVLARVLSKQKVILVSEGIERELAERMFFTYADSMGEAMELALSAAGRGASVNVMPEGPVIMPIPRAGVL